MFTRMTRSAWPSPGAGRRGRRCRAGTGSRAGVRFGYVHSYFTGQLGGKFNAGRTYDLNQKSRCRYDKDYGLADNTLEFLTGKNR